MSSPAAERDDSGLERERLLEERACRLVHELYEFADVVVKYIERSYRVSERPLSPDTTAPQIPGDPQPVRVHAPKLAELEAGQGRPTPKERCELVVAYRPLL